MKEKIQLVNSEEKQRYYYHGLSDFVCEETYDIMLKIIYSGGLKKRAEVHGISDNRLNHICLAKVNDEVNYYDENIRLHSAFSSWIFNGPCFIISNQVSAKKTPFRDTNSIKDAVATTDLVDEWRTYDNIPLDMIVGIALPFKSIDETYEEFPDIEEEKMFALR